MCSHSVWKQPACNGKNSHTHCFIISKIMWFTLTTMCFGSCHPSVGSSHSFACSRSTVCHPERWPSLFSFRAWGKGGPQGRAREQPMATLPCPLTLCKRGPLVDLSFPSLPERKEKQELAAPPPISLLQGGVNVVRQEHTFTSSA